MAYTVKNDDLQFPLSWIADEPWNWIADYSDDSEYTELDYMYECLCNEDAEGSRISEYNSVYHHDYTIEDIKREYNKRFPLMLANAFEAIAKDIKSGELIIEQEF